MLMLCRAYCGYSYTSYTVFAYGCSPAHTYTQQVFTVKYIINGALHISEQLALKHFSFIHTRQGMSTIDLGVHMNIEYFGLNIMTSVFLKSN